jgi:hypothetical protein
MAQMRGMSGCRHVAEYATKEPYPSYHGHILYVIGISQPEARLRVCESLLEAASKAFFQSFNF